MSSEQPVTKVNVVMSAKYWDSIQRDLRDAIENLNKITSRIAAYEREKTTTSGMVIDYADTQVRNVRKILENIVSPI